jgi:hypothetical protein
MSAMARMSANFYDCDGVTFDFIEGNEDNICITSPNSEISRLFQCDFSPLFYTTHYDDDNSQNPSMSLENLFDIHHAASKGHDYNREHILNHNWIDNVKRMIKWTQGTEVYFQALTDGDNMFISIYTNPVTCSHKIDEDGFLCSRIRIPSSRFHLTDTILDSTPKIVTNYQRVVCWYNINLENEQSYVLK